MAVFTWQNSNLTCQRQLQKFKPDLIFYNAGSDVLATDPLATLLLRVEDMCERDLFVVSHGAQQ
jgi:acetoin utilization deacetylase AcuC-like enzyme